MSLVSHSLPRIVIGTGILGSWAALRRSLGRLSVDHLHDAALPNIALHHATSAGSTKKKEITKKKREQFLSIGAFVMTS